MDQMLNNVGFYLLISLLFSFGASHFVYNSGLISRWNKWRASRILVWTIWSVFLMVGFLSYNVSVWLGVLMNLSGLFLLITLLCGPAIPYAGGVFFMSLISCYAYSVLIFTYNLPILDKLNFIWAFLR